jgi:hypothetical protein
MSSGGRKTVVEYDLQDLTIATRCVARARELLQAAHTPVDRADALAQVRLARAALDDVLQRSSERRQPR